LRVLNARRRARAHRLEPSQREQGLRFAVRSPKYSFRRPVDSSSTESSSFAPIMALSRRVGRFCDRFARRHPWFFGMFYHFGGSPRDSLGKVFQEQLLNRRPRLALLETHDARIHLSFVLSLEGRFSAPPAQCLHTFAERTLNTNFSIALANSFSGSIRYC
jgi:hypothetical protein